MRDSSIEDELASALQDSIEPLRSLLKQALRVRMLLLHVIRRAEVTEFANSISLSAPEKRGLTFTALEGAVKVVRAGI
jgi:hypothetical protein